jgi:hypothetical protein
MIHGTEHIQEIFSIEDSLYVFPVASGTYFEFILMKLLTAATKASGCSRKQ